MAESDFQWTQDHWEIDTPVSERRVATRNERLAWFGVIAVAVVAFELTADPALTVSIGCLKFGWDEFRLARWLKRTDPDRRRGKVCSRFYLAWGLWRVSVVAVAVAFILVFAHAFIEKQVGNGGKLAGPPPGFGSAMLVALAGFLLSWLVSCLAVISALRYRVKVWLGPEARWAREENAWPPQSVARQRTTSNRTKVILLSALITATMFGLIVVVIPLSFAFPPGQAAARQPPGALPLLAFFGFLIGVPILILVLLEVLGNRMIAETPAACWTSPADA